jgi:uncharacterized protein
MSHSAPQPNTRAWQRMLSGRRLDLLNPDAADIEIVDIAHGLARVARWNGQTMGEHAFSVAQHSLLVEEIAVHLFSADPSPEIRSCPPVWRLAALLHDAPEYVVGDLISPFKAAIGYDYKAFELRLLNAVHRRFAIPERLPATVAALIKHADGIAAYYEATGLAGFKVDEADLIFGKPQTPPHWQPLPLVPLPTAAAQVRFLSRFNELWQTPVPGGAAGAAGANLI